MIKRLAYIVLLLIFATSLSFAKIRLPQHNPVDGSVMRFATSAILQKDTIKKQPPEEDKKKIKEISKAKRQAKPEKIGGTDAAPDPKLRKRRPEGLDRPPEIPRRNGN